MSVEYFNYETTYRTDYQGELPKNIPMNKLLFKNINIDKYANKRPPVRYIDLEILGDFKDGRSVPFDMFNRKKPCVTTNPLAPFPNITNYQRTTPEERISSRNTRPRVYMVPQVCLDDIPEDVMYNQDGLAENLYTSDWKQAVKLAAPKTRKWPELRTVCEKNAEPVRFKPINTWTPLRNDIKNRIKCWEKVQTRDNGIDPKKFFHLPSREKSITKISLSKEESENLKRLTKENIIRLSYDVIKPGYTGFVPKIAHGIAPEKHMFTLADPNVTTLMQLHGNYKKF